MDARELIQSMMAESGMGSGELSRAMGKTSGFVSATLSRGSVPRLDTFVEMAEAMGYRVLLERGGKAEPIDLS